MTMQTTQYYISKTYTNCIFKVEKDVVMARDKKGSQWFTLFLSPDSFDKPTKYNKYIKLSPEEAFLELL
jgi:hypothetical protein